MLPDLKTPPSTDPHNALSRDDLHGKIDSSLIARLSDDIRMFSIKSFHPGLSAGRLDLAIKLLYLDTLGPDQPEGVRALYDAHIHAFSFGTMQEPGNLQKSGAKMFRAEFQQIHENIRRNGFDDSRSLVPLARDGSILNGAHRTASAIQLGLPLVGVETGLEPAVYDFRFFRNRGMADWRLDWAALAYIDRAPSARIALIRGRGRTVRVKIKKFGPLIYQKLLPSDQDGIISQIDWPHDHTADQKLPLTLVVFDTNAPSDDPEIYLLHSRAETLELARIFLNSVQPLNEPRSKRALYILRLRHQRMRHKIIQMLARLGVIQPLRKLYRSLRP